MGKHNNRGKSAGKKRQPVQNRGENKTTGKQTAGNKVTGNQTAESKAAEEQTAGNIIKSDSEEKCKKRKTKSSDKHFAI